MSAKEHRVCQDGVSRLEHAETVQDKQTETTFVTPFPDPVHIAKNDRGSFAN